VNPEGERGKANPAVWNVQQSSGSVGAGCLAGDLTLGQVVIKRVAVEYKMLF